MEVLAGPLQDHVERHEAAARDRDAWQVGAPHGAVGRHHEIAGEAVLEARDRRCEIRTAALLLALDQHLDVDRQPPALPDDRFRGQDRDEQGTLVVRHAAGEQAPVALAGFEGRRGPKLERIRRLHVVVAVDQDRWRPGCVAPLRRHDRMAARRHGLDTLEAGALKPTGDPGGRLGHGGAIGGIGADARDAAEGPELRDRGVEARVESRLDGGASRLARAARLPGFSTPIGHRHAPLLIGSLAGRRFLRAPVRAATRRAVAIRCLVPPAHPSILAPRPLLHQASPVGTARLRTRP